jgi:hypothetical protein
MCASAQEHSLCNAELSEPDGRARPQNGVIASMRTNARETSDADAWVLVFTDESDRSWEVHEIRDPILPDRRNRFIRSEYAAGWLLFVSGNERRRLAPYPPGWRFADAARLRCWVNDAHPVRAGASMTAHEVRELPPVSRSSQESA